MVHLTDQQESVTLFLNLLKALVTGEPYCFTSIPSETVWRGLRALCNYHNLNAIIYEQLRLSGIFEDCKPDQDSGLSQKEYFRLRAFRLIMMQMNRTMAFEDYYEEILKLGIKPLVVKGLILRDCWPDGNMRISGDEDLLIQEEDYPKLRSFFLSRGFKQDKEEPRPEEDLPDEMGFEKADEDIYYEVHRLLFSEDSVYFSRFNELYKDAFLDAEKCERGQYQFYTLNPTRHLFFIVSHMLKHFVMGGVGIRQLIDIIMFIRTYDQKIDRVWFKSLLQDFGLEVYWINLLEISRVYLGFEAAEYGMQFFESVEPDSADMLADMLDAGIFGGTSIERMHSANITLEAAQKHGMSGRVKGIWRALFPGRTYMERRYPLCKRSKWFLPAAYLRRFVDYACMRKKRLNVDAGDESALRIGMQRAALLEKYKIQG